MTNPLIPDPSITAQDRLSAALHEYDRVAERMTWEASHRLTALLRELELSLNANHGTEFSAELNARTLLGPNGQGSIIFQRTGECIHTSGLSALSSSFAENCFAPLVTGAWLFALGGAIVWLAST